MADYSEINDLNYSDDDAVDIRGLLISDAQGFSDGNVILRTDAEATKAQLEIDFNDIASLIDSSDDPTLTRFVFYFAGHGYGDGMGNPNGLPAVWQDYFNDTPAGPEPQGAGMFTDYIFLHDLSLLGPVTVEDVELELKRAAESDADLAVNLEKIASRQKIVVIDACHSGGFIGTGTAVDSVPRAYDGDETGISFIDGLTAITLYIESVLQGPADIGPATAVITAAGEQEFSYEYSGGAGIENGIFTHYFLEAPRFADINFDGYVTVSEAYGYTVRAIDALENPSLPGDLKFIPRLGTSGVDFVMFKVP
ncbi:MAG: caspase family protein [Spirochaetales bacterium]|nr:caspase family protein [Spirochaetales bacterium]